MQGLEEGIAKVQGILEEVRAGLNHMESRLDSKADKWEIQFLA